MNVSILDFIAAKDDGDSDEHSIYTQLAHRLWSATLWLVKFSAT